MMSDFNITDIQIRFIREYKGLFAFARIVLNNALVIDGIGIHHKLDGSGYRLTYPTKQQSHGPSITIAHPIQSNLSKAIELDIFQKVVTLQKDVTDNDRHYPTDY